jgi:hypothetical protein
MSDAITKKELKKELTPFEPEISSHKSKAKERFYRRLKEMSDTIDKEVVFEDRGLLEELCGTSRIHSWLKDPQFARWWWDEKDIVDELMALRQTATDRLKKMLGDRYLEPGDALKAIRLVFEVTDQFPSKKKEVRFLDEDLEKMDEDEVEREMISTRTKLKGTGAIQDEDIEEGE